MAKKQWSTKAHETPVWKQVCELVAAHSRTQCAVDGCEKSRELRQYCGMHYARLKVVGEHPKNEPRIKASKSHYAFTQMLSADTDECVEWEFYTAFGYPMITFKQTAFRVHRMVCEAINGPPPTAKHEAAHECGNSKCCNWRHLSWKTHADNIADKFVHGTIPLGEKHHAAKLTEDDVRSIRRLRHEKTRRELTEEFGIKPSTLDNVLSGATWRHVA